MVNTKNVAFKVNKQTPFSQTLDGAYGTVINYRPLNTYAKAGKQPEWKSHNVPLSNVPGNRKRKRHTLDDKDKLESSKSPSETPEAHATPPPPIVVPGKFTALNQQWLQRKPTRLRKGKNLSRGVDLDCWFTILSFSDPAQLLEMRCKIASCYRFLRDNPMLWKHSREYCFGTDMPDPPAELTEFQYAHLRHGHGCMGCGTPNTRKTYWAFLRRWCKTCLQKKTIKAPEALAMMRTSAGEDIGWTHRALPSGIFDSWGNFVGVGPATSHSLKTVYLESDVHKMIAEYEKIVPNGLADLSTEEAHEKHERLRVWHNKGCEVVEQRRVFAKKMELWEESTRSSKAFDYSTKKAARKEFFKERAMQLNPPITLKEMEACPSFRRAVAIPKDPNNISWLQLKPKLEKEAKELASMAAAGRPSLNSLPAPSSGTSTPSNSLDLHQAFMPSRNLVDFSGLPLPHNHNHHGHGHGHGHSHNHSHRFI